MSERRTKVARRVRQRSTAPIFLTERDLGVLCLVGLCRYVSTNQVAREFFPSLDRARRRIRELHDANYLAVTLASSTMPNLVSLGKLGKSTVIVRHPELEERISLAGTIRLVGVRHHLATVDLRLFASAYGQFRGAPLVRWSGGGSRRLAELGFRDHRLVPDGVAEFRGSSELVVIAGEVDLGTENFAVLSSKWTRYRALAAKGRVDALWIYADAPVARRAAIEEQVQAHGLGTWARVLGNEILARPVRALESRPSNEGSRA